MFIISAFSLDACGESFAKAQNRFAGVSSGRWFR